MVPLFFGHAAQQVRAALDAAAVVGPVAVVGDERLARRLAEAGREVVSVPPAEAAERLGRGGFGAVIAGGLARAEDWQQRLSSWCHAVQDGGLIVLVDRGQAVELSRRALCGGLSQVQQRVAGRFLVTSGRWITP